MDGHWGWYQTVLRSVKACWNQQLRWHLPPGDWMRAFPGQVSYAGGVAGKQHAYPTFHGHTRGTRFAWCAHWRRWKGTIRRGIVDAEERQWALCCRSSNRWQDFGCYAGGPGETQPSASQCHSGLRRLSRPGWYSLRRNTWGAVCFEECWEHVHACRGIHRWLIGVLHWQAGQQVDSGLGAHPVRCHCWGHGEPPNRSHKCAWLRFGGFVAGSCRGSQGCQWTAGPTCIPARAGGACCEGERIPFHGVPLEVQRAIAWIGPQGRVGHPGRHLSPRDGPSGVSGSFPTPSGGVVVQFVVATIHGTGHHPHISRWNRGAKAACCMGAVDGWTDGVRSD